jgi:endonuclease IV
VVHSSYLTVAIWSITSQNLQERKQQYILKHFEDQIKSCANLGALGLVVHLPRKCIKEISATLQILAPILIKYAVCLILEITAANLKEVAYADISLLNELIKNITTLKIPNNLWGLCVDTAHMWSAGVNIVSKEKMQAWLTALKYPEKIKLFHLNGSRKNKFNTGSDIHEVALSPNDEMFSEFITSYQNPSLTRIKQSAIYAITTFANQYEIPIILEVDRQHELYIQNLITIIKKIANSNHSK